MFKLMIFHFEHRKSANFIFHLPFRGISKAQLSSLPFIIFPGLHACQLPNIPSHMQDTSHVSLWQLVTKMPLG